MTFFLWLFTILTKTESANKIGSRVKGVTSQGSPKKQIMSKDPINNGNVYSNYSFTQTLNEVTVTVPSDVPIRSRDVVCTITKTHLLVQIKGVTKIDGDLHKAVKVGDSCWLIDNQRAVVVELAKTKTMEWWSCAIQGDEEIDTKKIKAEEVTDTSELDTETREVVDKLLFDQRQKEQGLPTSDEIDKMKVFEQFKAAHPEMDFSNAKFS